MLEGGNPSDKESSNHQGRMSKGDKKSAYENLTAIPSSTHGTTHTPKVTQETLPKAGAFSKNMPR